jgi:predicted nucleic acid-binding protein
VWIDHLRSGVKEMRQHLEDGQIVIHPLITAEIALGSLRDRNRTLDLLDLLPQLREAQIAEVRGLIEARRLHGRGIAIIDAHLVASVLINPPTLLWTRDMRLRKVAEGLGVHASLS